MKNRAHRPRDRRPGLLSKSALRRATLPRPPALEVLDSEYLLAALCGGPRRADRQRAGRRPDTAETPAASSYCEPFAAS
jgi:hypothetical protein